MAASGVRSSWLASAAKRRSPPAQGRLDVAEHPVERHGDLAHLGPRAGVRDPVRQRDLATGQGKLGDPGGGGCDPAQRAQRQPHETRPEQPGQDQRRGEHDSLGHLHVLEDVLRRAQRQPGDHCGAVLGRGSHQLV
jgi:hypothetical protein